MCSPGCRGYRGIAAAPAAAGWRVQAQFPLRCPLLWLLLAVVPRTCPSHTPPTCPSHTRAPAVLTGRGSCHWSRASRLLGWRSSAWGSRPAGEGPTSPAVQAHQGQLPIDCGRQPDQPSPAKLGQCSRRRGALQCSRHAYELLLYPVIQPIQSLPSLSISWRACPSATPRPFVKGQMRTWQACTTPAAGSQQITAGRSCL